MIVGKGANFTFEHTTVASEGVQHHRAGIGPDAPAVIRWYIASITDHVRERFHSLVRNICWNCKAGRLRLGQCQHDIRRGVGILIPTPRPHAESVARPVIR